MVNMLSFEDTHYFPPDYPGLEELVRFPDGDIKNKSIPNSTIWVFNAQEHQFQPDIHGADIGCGMTALIIEDIDHKEAADTLYNYLKENRRSGRVLGRGNHFVDICSSLDAITDIKDGPYKILLVHTHGPEKKTPASLNDALQQQTSARDYRQELSEELADLISSSKEMIGDWTHNSVEVDENNIIYRKGIVKVQPEKLYFLPAHLGAKIVIYTVPDESVLPYASMPHATGRSGPRSEKKVSREEAATLRQKVYIPAGISDASLRTEHESCYNSHDKIFGKLRNQHGLLFLPVGETTILSYVGKA